jgi:hypothetical protein
MYRGPDRKHRVYLLLNLYQHLAEVIALQHRALAAGLGRPCEISPIFLIRRVRN